VGTERELQRQIEYFEGKYELSPQSRVFAPLADLYRRAGRTEEALKLLQEGLEQHPDYVSALVVLGRTHDTCEDPDAARAAWQRVMAVDPENLVALRRLAEDAEERGAWRTAVTLWERYVKLEPQDEAAEAGYGRSKQALAADADPSASPADPADAETVEPTGGGADAAAREPAGAEEEAAEPEAGKRKRPSIAWGGPSDPLAAATVEEAVRAVEEVSPEEEAAGARDEAAEGPAADADEPDTSAAADDAEAAAGPEPDRHASATLRGLATQTLADIYLAQGYRDKALGVLREILARDPGRDDVRARLEKIERNEDVAVGAGGPDAGAGAKASGPAGAGAGTPLADETASPPPAPAPRRRSAERSTERDQFASWLARIRQRQQESDPE
jgi:tetratricopeptide (TPR) repeat protein